MPSIIQGRIVFPLDAVPDPQGWNAKSDRGFVVVSSQSDIQAGGDVLAVAITGELKSSPKDHYVPLKWGPSAKTGLRKESAALCTWLISISQEDVRYDKGLVDPKTVSEIVEKLKVLQPEPRIIKKHPPAASS